MRGFNTNQQASQNALLSRKRGNYDHGKKQKAQQQKLMLLDQELTDTANQIKNQILLSNNNDGYWKEYNNNTLRKIYNITNNYDEHQIKTILDKLENIQNNQIDASILKATLITARYAPIEIDYEKLDIIPQIIHILQDKKDQLMLMQFIENQEKPQQTLTELLLERFEKRHISLQYPNHIATSFYLDAHIRLSDNEYEFSKRKTENDIDCIKKDPSQFKKTDSEIIYALTSMHTKNTITQKTETNDLSSKACQKNIKENNGRKYLSQLVEQKRKELYTENRAETVFKNIEELNEITNNITLERIFILAYREYRDCIVPVEELIEEIINDEIEKWDF